MVVADGCLHLALNDTTPTGEFGQPSAGTHTGSTTVINKLLLQGNALMLSRAAGLVLTPSARLHHYARF
jgi:hypothetical protein